MWISIVKRIISGIACGGVALFIAITILRINNMTPDISIIWFYMVMSYLLGIYFGIASLIFDIENWSPLKKLMVHFSLSVVVYFAIALFTGWVPFIPEAILLSLGIFILVYAIFWFSANSYYKKVEESMNDSLKNK